MTSFLAGRASGPAVRLPAGMLPARLRRAAHADDAPLLQRIASAAYSPYLERMGGLRPGPMDTDYLAAVEESEAWVASLTPGRRLPCSLVTRTDGMVLENVAVLPSHHGRGVGRALLELAEERATARGCTRASASSPT